MPSGLGKKLCRAYITLCIVTSLLLLSACNSTSTSKSTTSSNLTTSSNSTSDGVEPYVLKGRVIDAQGHPLEGVVVFADNQFLYDSNLVLYTDEDGYYRIELPEVATTWKPGSRHTIQFHEMEYEFDMTPDVDRSFAGKTGAIRNFVWEDITREFYIYIDLNESYSDYPYEIADLELTLTPIGPLIDGSEGKVITLHGSDIDQGGYGLADVPVGRYKAIATYLTDDKESRPLLIGERAKDELAESIEFEFSRQMYSDDRIADLVVKHPLSEAD